MADALIENIWSLVIHGFRRVPIDPILFAFTDHRGPLASTGQSPEEVFADQFAAALLMPAKEVRAEIDTGTPHDTLFARFQVSPEAMRYRLINLGIAG